MQPNDPFTFILSYKKDIINHIENDLAGKVPVAYDNPDGSKRIEYEQSKTNTPILTAAGVDQVKTTLDTRITKVAAMTKITRRDALANAIDTVESMNVAITLKPDVYLYFDKSKGESEDDKMLEWIGATQNITGLLFDFFMIAEAGGLRDFLEKILKTNFDQNMNNSQGKGIGSMFTQAPRLGDKVQ